MRWRQFQFTPLREGRRWRLWLAAGWLCYFNSRPSARGDRSCRRRHAGQAPFQFTPLREGRPSTAGAVGSPPAISIHAPPRGATHYGCGQGGCFRCISIHAPPRGATPPAQPQIRTACVFQFTPLREGRQVYKSHGFGRTYFNSRPSARGDSPGRGYQLLINISIHAPPRGATAGCITVVAVSSNFNSRPSARGDRHSSNFA